MANILKFVLVGDDQASRAFDSFALSVDRANKAADRNTAALEKQQASAKKTQGGFLGLVGAVTGFGDASTAASSKSGGFQKILAGLNLATGVLEPAMAGLVVAGGGLAAAFTSAGLGLGAFGLVAQSVLSQASSAAQKYTAAQQKLNLATTSKQRQAALLAEKQALYGLDAAQKQVVFSIIGAQNAWQGFTKAATPGVAKVLAAAVKLLPEAFALLKPFLAPVETALAGIIASMRAGIGPTSTFSKIMHDFAASSGTTLSLALHTAGNLLLGLLGVLHAFLPTGVSLLAWVEKASAAFAQWGTTLSSHTGFQSLMTTFRTETPLAVQVLKNLATVILNVGKAMTGLSGVGNSKALLQALLPLSGILADLSKNTALDRIALYLLAAGSAARKLVPAFQGVKLGIEGIGTALKFASANPIVLVAAAVIALGAAFYLAWEKSAGFRDVIKSIGAAMLAVGIVIVQADKVIVDSFLSMVGTILHGAADAFGWIPGLGGKLKGASAAFDSFKAGVDGAFNGTISTMQRWQNELNASSKTSGSAATKIQADFNAQAKAAGTARTAVSNYAAAIAENGVASSSAQAARDALLADLKNAGVNAVTAHNDVAAYTAEVARNGVNSDQARAARQRLNNDILAAISNSRQGKTDIGNYTTAIQQQGAKSDAARAARQRLITDLTNAGVSAKTASGLVNNLSAAISKIPSKTVKVIAEASGSGTISIVGSGWANGQGNIRFHAAKGAYVNAGTGPTADDVLARVSKGELIVPARMVTAGMVDHLRGKIPGFAAGGFPGLGNMLGGVPGAAGGFTGTDAKKAVTAGVTEAMAAAKALTAKAFAAAQSAALIAGISAKGITGAGVSNASAFAALQSAAKAAGWTGAQWAALNNVEMREAGYSLTATNPSSGAYGLAQFINGPSEYAQYGGNSTTAAGQAVAMVNYIKQRYGTPSAAWAHELAYGWYDRGGALKPGLTLAYNGTGRPEQVTSGDDMAAAIAELRALRSEVRQLTGVAAAIPAKTGQHVAAGVNSAGAGAAFRRRYPAGGA